jgi:hypothetical protein
MMARTELTVQVAVKAGILDLIAGATAGNAIGTDGDVGKGKFANDGKTVLVASIGGAGSETITFTAVADKYGRTEALAPEVATGKIAVIGPFMPELWNQTGGMIYFELTTKDAADKFTAVRVANPS